MNTPSASPAPVNSISETKFWQRLIEDEQLQNCDDLAKLLAGCEIIAAVDSIDLLAA